MGVTLKNLQGIQGARRLMLIQLSLCLVISVFCFIKIDVDSGLSAVIGSLVYIIPNAYFAEKLFKHTGAQAAKKIVNGFYSGEAIKLALSIALFGLVFKFLKVNAIVFFAAYIAAQLVFWFAPLIIVIKPK